MRYSVYRKDECQKLISITELAKLFHTTIRTIRYYEELGLIEKATRIKGRRYFTKKEVIRKMNEIRFLKSLDFKLADIGVTLKNPLYIRPLLMNIRLELIQIEINKLGNEYARLVIQLQHYGWKQIEITDNDILKKMKENYYELLCIEKDMSEKEHITTEDSKKFVEYYKTWHEKVGVKLFDEHIKTIAFNPNIILKENLKKIFQMYFKKII